MPKPALPDAVKERITRRMCEQVSAPRRAAPVYRGVLDQVLHAMRGLNSWDRMAVAASILTDESPAKGDAS